MASTLGSFHQHFNKKQLYLELQAQSIACCLLVSQVNKIFSLMALTPVAKTPDYLVGVFNYHGVSVPVIDLAMRLGETKDAAYSINTTVLLCNTLDAGILFAMIVSDIGNIITLNSTELQLVQQFPGQSSPFSAICQQAKQSRFVLNTDALLDSSLTQLYTLSPKEVNSLISHDFKRD
ncbi:MAG: hypothetical protein GQ569_14110 [Methylococcaceae bacterium]|nr:hypothetical protein [Methylococcaceae bacterium]